MQTDSLRVLVIEDNPLDADLLRYTLARARGVQLALVFAETLNAGLALLGVERFDVVLLDLTLPDSRGIETFESVQAHSPDVPIVVLTGMDDEQLAVQALRLGAQDYLSKESKDHRVLVRAIRYAVERSRLRAELKRAMEIRQESEERFRRMVEENADGILITNEQGTILFSNPSLDRMFGKAPEEMWGERLGPDLIPNEANEISIISQGDEPGYAEVRVVRTTWDGQPSLLASLRDITVRRRAHELQGKLEVQDSIVRELRELERMKSDFIETVTHELRTPMTPLSSSIDLFLDGALGELSERQHEFMTMMARNVRRLARFATDVLAISRLDSGKRVLASQKLALAEIARSTVDLLRAKAKEKGSTLRCDVNPEAEAIADADALAEILTNLIDNAIAHTPAGTTIVVGDGPTRGGFVPVTVADDGPGIPQEEQDKIFRKFYQYARRSGPGYQGTGIGLAVSKSLAEKMGGHIRLVSSPGEGATFTIELPARPLREEVLFGRIAVAHGLADPSQVEEISELQSSRAGTTERMGDLLVERGVISAQDRDKILRVQAERLAKRPGLRPTNGRVGETLFGALALSHDVVSSANILNEAIRTQESLRRLGQHQRLGEVLIRLGYAKPSQITRILASQEIRIVRCEACDLQINASKTRDGVEPACPNCGGALTVVSPEAGVNIAVTGDIS